MTLILTKNAEQREKCSLKQIEIRGVILQDSHQVDQYLKMLTNIIKVDVILFSEFSIYKPTCSCPQNKQSIVGHLKHWVWKHCSVDSYIMKIMYRIRESD